MTPCFYLRHNFSVRPSSSALPYCLLLYKELVSAQPVNLDPAHQDQGRRMRAHLNASNLSLKVCCLWIEAICTKTEKRVHSSVNITNDLFILPETDSDSCPTQNYGVEFRVWVCAMWTCSANYNVAIGFGIWSESVSVNVNEPLTPRKRKKSQQRCFRCKKTQYPLFRRRQYCKQTDRFI